MEIPRNENEFFKDILENCGVPSIPDFVNIIRGISITSKFIRTLTWPDHIKRRIADYGVSDPTLLERQSEESIEKYIARIWEKNADAILAARGLITKDRSALIGTTTANRPKVKEWFNETEESKDWNNGWFTQLPYHERKFVAIVKSFEDYQKPTPDIQRFRISHIPSDIIFEDCLPTVGELYIAHPYRRGVYLPVSKYEHLIFRERIHELSKVMMALGATEIKTIQNSDSKLKSTDEESSSTNISGEIGKWAKASGMLDSLSKSLKESQKSDSIVINFKNDPFGLPSIPEGLIWYPHDKEWQHIAECRLHGNILEYEIILSSKEINFVSELERSNIEAQAKVLFASGSFSHSAASQKYFKEVFAKSTNILIKFKSRKDY